MFGVSGAAGSRQIPVPLHSSARRYLEEGYFRRPLRNLFCLSLYAAGLPAASYRAALSLRTG